MDFGQNLKAFLKRLPIQKMSGHQKFLAMAAFYVRGQENVELMIRDITIPWRKSLLRVLYNPSFYDRAQVAGWVTPIRKGVFVVDSEGFQHLSDLAGLNSSKIANASGGDLFIFDERSTHSFDKLLRSIFANAKSKVSIADSWVDETIFDNVLDSIPKTLEIHLLYNNKKGTFDSRVTRFKREYEKFVTKKYSNLHDRFLIVDDFGYILGPSIKDAASNSPALVVALNKKDSAMLGKFFNTLWLKVK
jgi:hypothetical protein